MLVSEYGPSDKDIKKIDAVLLGTIIQIRDKCELHNLGSAARKYSGDYYKRNEMAGMQINVRSSEIKIKLWCHIPLEL